MGETDRLLTILTVEQGIIRAIAPGARKHKSRLGGRSGQFVINELLVIQGRQLDKVVQAETVRSFPGLATHLAKLTASQYLAELVLCQALGGQPQEALFALFVEHLERLDQAAMGGVMASLCQGIFHLLALAGVAPEVQRCCVSQTPIVPDLMATDWHVGFSAIAGGIIQGQHLPNTVAESHSPRHRLRTAQGRYSFNSSDNGLNTSHRPQRRGGIPQTVPGPTPITAAELALLQRLGQPELLMVQETPGVGDFPGSLLSQPLWSRIEHLLRQYAQYHFDRPIRSAALLEACFPVTVAPE